MGNPHRRRSVLAGAGALALAAFLPGCTGGGDPTPTPSATPAPPPDPLLALLEARIALAVACDAVATRHPNLSGRLLPVRDQTREQVTVLRRALALPTPAPTTTAASTSTSGVTSSGAPATGSAPAVPSDAAAALTELTAAVQAAGDVAATLCVTTSAERAPLVGSLAAAAAGHLLVLA